MGFSSGGDRTRGVVELLLYIVDGIFFEAAVAYCILFNVMVRRGFDIVYSGLDIR